MQIELREPPRTFTVKGRALAHTADVMLDPGELVTFRSGSGSEFDVTRTEFGYYATPSLNGRLAEHGLRAALTRGGDGKLFLLLVERGREDAFDRYLDDQDMRVVAWLDSGDAAERLAQILAP